MTMETVEAPQTVVVKRSKWLRGDPDKSCLRDKQSGKKCCLGFLTLAAGFIARQINGKLQPDDLTKCIKGLTKPENSGDKILPINTKTCKNMMNINDDKNIDDETREKKISREGKRIGVNFKFVD